MAGGQSYLRSLVVLVVGLISFCLGFFLLIELGFMLAYFSSPGQTGGWFGPGWRKFIREVVEPGPMILLWGWAIATASTGWLGLALSTDRRRVQSKVTASSMCRLLSNCGLSGSGLAALVLLLVVVCRIVA
jgi:divalent metal cation (Fe/Co/Zn/Cd) transporter